MDDSASALTAVLPSTPLAALDVVVMDTETTGLDRRIARFVQIGAVKMHGSELLADERFDRLVNPGIPIPARTTAIHRIADAHVAGEPKFPDLADALDAYIGHRVIVGHTIAYDLTILDREERLAGRSPRARRALDVRILAEVADIGLSQFDLDHLASALSVDVEARHTAIGDALTTARVYAALIPLLRQKGIRTLAEAETATRNLATRQAPTAAGLATQPAALPPPTSDPLSALARIDRFSYVHRVADVMSAPAVFAAPDETIRTVVRRMMEKRVSSVLVEVDGVMGIATERDMLRAIDGQGAAGLDAPVANFVNKPLLTIPAHEFVYRAIGRMQRLGIRHLGVTDPTGAMAGMVTVRNLLKHRATTALILGDTIETAWTSRDLARAWAMVPRATGSLVADGVGSRDIAAVISAEICALTRRAAIIAERAMANAERGGPPVPYAVLVLGSAGRGESLLAADQDNAIVHANPPLDGLSDEAATGEAERVDRWFADLGQHIATILDEAGIPLCKGGVMAKNALWRHSVSGWHALIDSWVRRQRPEDILNVDIFFDGVPVHGDLEMGEAIFAHARAVAGASKSFQTQLSEVARRWQAPFTLIGGLRTDEQNRIDLKKHGLLPIFTAGRVLSIRHGEAARSTAARLRATISHEEQRRSEIEALIEAHETILAAILEQQLVDGNTGTPLSPKIEPRRLSGDRRAALKTAIRQVATAVDLVSEGRIG
jgi:DNA polymerase-3 subunit epsilon/CBS domain-containing protein